MLSMTTVIAHFVFFFFNDTATTEIYTLSLHDALPISVATRLLRIVKRREYHQLPVGSRRPRAIHPVKDAARGPLDDQRSTQRDRKSTRRNSSHLVISYAVFCLKKKKTNTNHLYSRPST